VVGGNGVPAKWARRLATRVNIVLTVALAFAGAGAKVLGDALVERQAGHSAAWLLGCGVAGIVVIFFAFVRVLTKRQATQRPPTASAYLLPPEDLNLTAGDPMMERAFLAMAAAAYELHARNAEERRRLTLAQQWLLVGAALTLSCGAAYTWVKPAPAVPTPPSVRAGRP
jgi:drug/metabolite transporter (DMT)-like permease